MRGPAYIDAPQRLPAWLRLGLWVSRRIAGEDLLIGRLLGWYPRAAVGSGVLEALIADAEGRVDERLLKLARLQASFAVACPFCADLNGVELERCRVTPEELAALRGQVPLEAVPTFGPAERLALAYVRLISQTPLRVPREIVDQLGEHFSEREIVVLATTAAQVNYWSRLIQALGVPPLGRSGVCLVQPGLVPAGEQSDTERR